MVRVYNKSGIVNWKRENEDWRFLIGDSIQEARYLYIIQGNAESIRPESISLASTSLSQSVLSQPINTSSINTIRIMSLILHKHTC
ncbi:MAG: hypothetical protein ACI9UJ_002202 [bacterium]|jgi:hypothetical protein